MAIGRRPNTAPVEGLGYEAGKPVSVDDWGVTRSTTGCTRSATSTAVALLTHMGKYQAAIAAEHIAGRQDRTPSTWPTGCRARA